jgi:hypothetical protein
MAEVLFGKPGRGRQVRDWTDDKLRRLGKTYWHTVTYQPPTKNPKKLRDGAVAKLISERDSRWFGKDPERIRRQLPKAKRIFYEECVKDIEDGCFPGDDDPAILKKMGVSLPEQQPLNLTALPHLGTPWVWIDLGLARIN